MILVLNSSVSEERVSELEACIKSRYRVQIHVSKGEGSIVLGLVGDTAHVDIDSLSAQPDVERVTRVGEPYKKANRKFHPSDTIVKVPTADGGCVEVGGTRFIVIAGPCSVETEPQITEVAEAVKASGAHMLRGGAYKPRTSPYSFQGLGADGIELLIKARSKTGLPIVSEIMSSDKLGDFEDVDIIQVGARNMQNFSLLKLLGETKKPILLKRGLANTIEEFLMSAEYIMAAGNENVILCERGIRTFETATRNTLDITAVPLLKKLTHLPVIIDPSHAAGIPWLVRPLTLAGIAAGADGVMIEVHNDPPRALSDGAQSLTPPQFNDIMLELRKIAPVFGREI